MSIASSYGHIVIVKILQEYGARGWLEEEQPVGKRRARCSHRLLHALYDHHKEGGEEMRWDEMIKMVLAGSSDDVQQHCGTVSNKTLSASHWWSIFRKLMDQETTKRRWCRSIYSGWWRNDRMLLNSRPRSKAASQNHKKKRQRK